MKKLLVILFLLMASKAWAIPTWDASNTATTTIDNDVTVNLTVGGGCTNQIVIATIAWQVSGIGTVSSMTIDGVGATFVAGVSHGAGLIGRRIEMWRRVGTGTGSKDVVATMGQLTDFLTISATSYCGVHQTVPTGTATTADNDAANDTVSTNVTLTSGDLAVDAAMGGGNGSSILTVGAGQTQRVNNVVHAGVFETGASEEGGTGTVAMSWTADTVEYMGIIAVPLKPAASAAVPKRRPVYFQ